VIYSRSSRTTSQETGERPGVLRARSADERVRLRVVAFETLTVRNEGAVVFAEIAAPPMNLLGPGLVRDLVSLLQHAEAEDTSEVLVFSSADPDYDFGPARRGRRA
jgi:hypothetical protein